MWIDSLRLKRLGKIQSYNFDDVGVKGSHINIFNDNRKIAEALSDLDNFGNLVW